MVVYGEYLFLENFITGIAVLYLTMRIGGTRSSLLRLAAGAAFCGGSAFILFLPLNLPLSILLRGLCAGLICAVSMGRRNLLKHTLLFFLISVITGGCAMALFLWMQVPVLMGNGVIYLQSLTYVTLTVCGIPALLLTEWFVRLIRRKGRADEMTGVVKLRLEEYTCCLRACVDSGNSLRDPVSGSAVILIDRKGSRLLPFGREAYPQRLTAVPYRTVGLEHGMLEGIRIDRLEFSGKICEKPVLAYYDGEFGRFEVLLNREILEGGLMEHDSDSSWNNESKGGTILPASAGIAEKKTAG